MRHPAHDSGTPRGEVVAAAVLVHQHKREVHRMAHQVIDPLQLLFAIDPRRLVAAGLPDHDEQTQSVARQEMMPLDGGALVHDVSGSDRGRPKKGASKVVARRLYPDTTGFDRPTSVE